MAQWARIGGGVSVSLSEFAIIYLPLYELKEGGALPVVGRETTVYGASHRLCGRANLNIFGNEACVKRSVVKATKERLSDFVSELAIWSREGVHLKPLPFRDCPPRLA